MSVVRVASGECPSLMWAIRTGQKKLRGQSVSRYLAAIGHASHSGFAHQSRHPETKSHFTMMLHRHHSAACLAVVAAFILCTLAQQQQQQQQPVNPNIQSIVDDVFSKDMGGRQQGQGQQPQRQQQQGQGQQPQRQQQQQQQQQQQPQRPATSGFNRIVTPEPMGSQIDFMSISGKAQCLCVPYHMCDPTTNTPIGTTGGAATGTGGGATGTGGGATGTGGGTAGTGGVPQRQGGSAGGTGGGAAQQGGTGTGAAGADDSFDGFGVIDIRFNADDPVCDHFLDVCCDSGSTRTEGVNPPPVSERPNRPQGCGLRNVGGIDFKIAGATDNEAGFGEFPWTVALLHGGNFSYFCGGSLIHPQVVLTAVHCVIGRQPSAILARAGEWDAQTTRERLPYQEVTGQRILTHPQYNPRNVAWDFALLILSSPIQLGDHINTVCLPAPNATPPPRTTCFATGWGKDKFGQEGRYSTIMKRVPLPIVDFQTCQTQLRGTRLTQKFALDRSFLCAGGQRGLDTCQGDGGAPLVCPIGNPAENRYEQGGIVAWGISCNDEIPAAYANVALARSWIDEQMLANGYPVDSYTRP